MPKTPTPNSTVTTLDTLLSHITVDYPGFSFVEGTQFSWHAGTKYVSFKRSASTERGTWALLHELGHALLDHTDYHHDIELLQIEATAWEKARALAENYSLMIDDDYIQDCLDTYRDWLHLRATCPTCFARSLQASPRCYHCFNCGAEWQVTRSRLCRPYRLQTV
jgi:hypothetical protein